MTMRARLRLLACLRGPVLDEVCVVGVKVGIGVGVRVGVESGLGLGLGLASPSPSPNLTLRSGSDSIGSVPVLSFSCLRSVGGHLGGKRSHPHMNVTVMRGARCARSAPALAGAYSPMGRPWDAGGFVATLSTQEGTAASR
eukprot:scaffold35208_cov34-Phaeocystis_antarctica.AAC.1